MTATDIIDMLEGIGRRATPRLSPAVQITADNAEARRARILQSIRETVLPRRLEFSAPGGTVLAIEVNNGRITDVYSISSGEIPHFETEPRDVLIEKLARLVSDLALAGDPLQLVSGQPDGPLEADDVGITFTEVMKACAEIELPSEPHVAVVPDPAPEPVEITSAAPETEPAIEGLAQSFFDGAQRFALGRVLTGIGDMPPQLDGICADGEPLHPTRDLLDRFARDLAGWDTDCAEAMTHPQLIVMRPSGGNGTALAILRDGQGTAAAIHGARKLGAVVNLWKILRGANR